MTRYKYLHAGLVQIVVVTDKKALDSFLVGEIVDIWNSKTLYSSWLVETSLYN